MELSQGLKDSILAGVLDKVKSSLTPADDTPDDDGIVGLVKNAIADQDDKQEGIMGLIGSALSSGSEDGGGIMDMLGSVLGAGKEHDEEPADSKSGGLLDMLGGLFGGRKEKQRPDNEQDTGGLLGMLGDLLGKDTEAQERNEKDSGLMGMIDAAIGGEGVLGSILESVLKSKNISSSQLQAGGSQAAGIKELVIDLISQFVINKVKANLTSGQTAQSGFLGQIIDALTPDN